MGDNLILSFITTGIGLLMVFAILGFLILILLGVGKLLKVIDFSKIKGSIKNIFKKKNNEPKIEAKSVDNKEDNSILIAVITAAISEYMSQGSSSASPCEFKVKNIRRI